MSEQEDIRHALAGYAPELLAQWLVSLNSYAWSEDCPVAKPEGFDESPSAFMQPLWDVLHHMVPDEDFSQQWWHHQKLGTSEEWALWYDARMVAKGPKGWDV